MVRLIVAGSRGFDDYELLKAKLDHFLQNIKEPIEIVSGTARGADTLGERYARERGYKIKQFPADWFLYGKQAGYLRNKQMALYGTHCAVFWDGESSGTKMMIDLCKEFNVPYRIVRYTPRPKVKPKDIKGI